MKQWFRKHTKLVIGAVVGITSVAITLGISLPIVIQSKQLYRSPLEKQLDNIVKASSKERAEFYAYKLYGVDKDKDNKDIVRSAKVFADYVFENKNKIQFEIYQNSGVGYRLDQKLITVNFKDNKNGSLASGDYWYSRFSNNSDFAFVFSFMDSRTVDVKFVPGKIKVDPTRRISEASDTRFKIFATMRGSLAGAGGWKNINIKNVDLSTFGKKENGKLKEADKLLVAKWIIDNSETKLITDPKLIKDDIYSISVNKVTGEIEVEYKFITSENRAHKEYTFVAIIYKQLEIKPAFKKQESDDKKHPSKTDNKNTPKKN